MKEAAKALQKEAKISTTNTSNVISLVELYNKKPRYISISIALNKLSGIIFASYFNTVKRKVMKATKKAKVVVTTATAKK